MNVTMTKIDNVTANITVSIEEKDYQEKVAKDLKEIGLKHKIDGFRPGKVPAGILKKMFGKQVLLDVVNRETYDALIKYIEDNKLNILGEPIIDAVKEIDFANDKDFTFNFEVGFAPQVEVKLDKKIKVPYYTIEVDQEMIDRQNEMFRQRFGAQVPGEEVDKKALVKGAMFELNEDGSLKEGGIAVANGIVSPEYFKSDDERAKFIGKKVNDKVVFNPWNTCNGNVAEMASMLNIDKANADVKSDFEITISEIIVLKPAELNEEFFNNVFGKDTVKTEEEYFAKVKEMIANQLKNDSNYRFTVDAEEVIKKHVGNMELPSAFLKKWLLKQDEKRNPETIDEEFARMVPSLEWQLIKEQLMKELGVKVEESDLLAVAKFAAAQQFAQYGMTNMPDDVVEKYAQDILANKEYRKNIVDRAVEDKLFAAIKEAVSLTDKTVTVKEFNALFEK
jgi:trigger factor